MTTKLEVNTMIVDGELNVEMIGVRESFHNSDVILLKEKCVKYINELVNYLKNEDDIYFTPNDFDALELDEEDLNVLFQ